MSRTPFYTVTCEECGRKIGGYIPAGGDGSLHMPSPHKDPKTGKRCEGVYGTGVDAITPDLR